MFDEQNRAIDEYMAKWQNLIATRKDNKNKEFFERLKPTAVGWKTTDLAEYDKLFNEWREACDQIHVGRMNDRWIATLHLKDAGLNGGIEIIKLMQRRPGSTDAVGLDHLDFMDMEETNTKAILTEEDDLKWSDEENGLCRWTSVWFAETEAKLRQGTVLDVCIAELQGVNKGIRGKFIPAPTESTGVPAAEVE